MLKTYSLESLVCISWVYLREEACLAGQQAPEVRLSPSPRDWNYWYTHHAWHFYVGSGNQAQVLTLREQALYRLCYLPRLLLSALEAHLSLYTFELSVQS